MRTRPRVLTLLCGAGLSAAAIASAPSDSPPATGRRAVESTFLSEFPGVSFYHTGAAVTTISGAPVSFGDTPVKSAENFLAGHADVLGIAPADLMEGSLAGDGEPLHGLMPVRDEAGRWTGAFKFTLVSYLQTRGGVPVYMGDVRLLARNEPGSPVVLVRSNLFDLGGFRPNAVRAQEPNIAGAFNEAALKYPGIGGFTPPRVVIFAGDDLSRSRPPVLATVFEGTVGMVLGAGYEKWRLVADAETGKILFSESLIYHTDVNGQVQGMATTGVKAAACNPEAVTGMPYARASIGATTVFADANGNFTIPNAGSGSVSVTGSLQGLRFEMYTPTALEPTLSTTVTPPGPANILFNAADTDEVRTAAVNAYLQANRVRDYLLVYSPGYPTIATQTAFRANVAVSGTCNAFYDGASINFYNAGGGCNNTAFNDVVHHEYGHHIVSMAGSGQGEYGEGTGDCMGVIVSDISKLAVGFNLGDCTNGIRNADNTCQYSASSCSSCGSEIHACGQLISGCVWSLRNSLQCSNPADYRAVLSDLVTNAILLHTGTSITSQICTDYLTLDDNDNNLGNGTPHSCQILKAFNAHGLASYSGDFAFTHPTGLPVVTSPAGGGTVQVQAAGLCLSPQANSGVMFVDPENDGTFTSAPMTPLPANLYQGAFPATPCLSVIRYYFTVQATNGCTVTDPPGAPANFYTTISGYSATTTFQDNFQTDKGWTTSADATVTTGFWNRGVPVDHFGSAPQTDYDGSGQCYLTDNRTGTGVGSYDIDGGHVVLTSPTMDATGGGEAFLSYARWYDNTGAGGGADPNNDTFVIQVSNNNGGSWVNLETVGPVAQSSGGWNYVTFKLSSKLALTNQMKVRYDASDLNSGSVVEAAVDAVQLQVVSCTPPCPADFNGDGFVNGDDFDQFAIEFDAGTAAADVNHDGFTNGDDFDYFSQHFDAGC